ncbi:tryptophan synthase subunit alpha [Alkalicoccobacillus gibsonii]|jgi:tryptophan synthase alpha chain|uniref:tryptophan synthase subunit alpha n=1 Tax=Alkalicoccobacillus gibsonii TaxID=79881 RepID=UPI00193313A0|nr:tryptophan synthase subunit alpha [Alkalicoccobacillus gibsonii]MBM0064652.1 tryptophan synthase subunit alpha [Alkalicoccobacillus gibsonii]
MSSERLQNQLEKDKELFIPFITAGDPTPEVTIDLALTLQEAGASILELGIPYSDPLADGPTIQAASKRALSNGMSLTDALQLVPKMRDRGLTIPVIIFTYVNPLLQYGMKRFTEEAAAFGVDGILVPDLPYEESDQLSQYCENENLSLISLVAPTSKERIKKIASRAQGFLYCVSSLGVTGARTDLDPRIETFLQTVREASRVPIAVGFGISTREQVQTIQGLADGVVVGSALVEQIEKQGESLKNPAEKELALQRIKSFVKALISE